MSASRSHHEPNYVGIVTPKPGQDFKTILEGFLELVRKIQDEGATENDLLTLPTGIRLVDDRVIHLSSSNDYRETIEFSSTLHEFGSGSSGDPIRVVKDNMTGIAHVLKTYYIDKAVVEKYQLEEFHENQIRCWCDLNKSTKVPELYLVQVQDNKIMLHMEELENTITLKDLIFKHRPNIAKQPGLLKPWAVNILRLILCLIRQFHSKGWTHNDLNSENVLVRLRSNRPPNVNLLDFGDVERSDDIQRDMEDIAALFQGLLFGRDGSYMRNYTIEEGKEISDLLKKCSEIVGKQELPNFIRQVQSCLYKAKKKLGHGKSNREMFIKITRSMFPDRLVIYGLVVPSPPDSPTSKMPQLETGEERSIKNEVRVDDLYERLAKLKLDTAKTEKNMVTPMLHNSTANSELVTSSNRESGRPMVRDTIAAEERPSNDQEATNNSEDDE